MFYKNKKVVIIVIVLLVTIVSFFIFKSKKTTDVKFYAQVQKGPFEIAVAVTGELEAMNKENILIPEELRSENVRIYQVKILELVPEGTIVDSGEFVASLDKTEITTKLRESQDDLEQQKISYSRTQNDTSMSLGAERNNIINQKYDIEERTISVEQSRFEPPATQRQAQLNLDKTIRNHEITKKNYLLKVISAQSSMKEAEMRLQRPIRRIESLQAVMEKFTITAPKRGMVIYTKERHGDKRKVGSLVSPWDPSVATLPDLSVMISRTYVSEVDINRVIVGQKVRVGVDAFPDRKYQGEVIKVSNIGEQIANSDTKVFEVVVKIFGSDPILRPYMTTSNNIVISMFKDTVFIPIETIHNEDSIPFVYTKSGNKQIVLTGDMNENQVIIVKGLSPGEEIYLSMPDQPEKFNITGKDIIPLIKARDQKKKKDIAERERLLKEQNDNLKNSKLKLPSAAGKSPSGRRNSEARETKRFIERSDR